MAWVETQFEEPERIEYATFAKHGDYVEGVFAETVERKNSYGKNEVHILVKTGEGADGIAEIKSIRANQRLLAQVASVKRGKRILIKYVDDQVNDGMDKAGEPLKPTKLFRVAVDDGRPSSRDVSSDDIPF